MLISLEVRWFYAGTLPAAILAWFEQEKLGGQFQPPEEREDVYLYMPECEYLGIKLRQGRLEVKWRQAELGIVGLGQHVEGKLEKWGKWLCEDPTAASFQPEVAIEQSLWVSVKKVRSQRLYDRCSIELTQLRLEDKDWWSLAFETVGAEASQLELQNVARSVFESYSDLQLQARDSYAYPHWLSSSQAELGS